jgi:amidase
LLQDLAHSFHRGRIEHIINMTTKNWETVAAHRRQTLRDKIPQQWRLSKSWTEAFTPDVKKIAIPVPGKSGILSPRELDITENYDATSLVEQLASGQFSSYDVTVAFCKRAAIAHQLVRISYRCFNTH